MPMSLKMKMAMPRQMDKHMLVVAQASELSHHVAAWHKDGLKIGLVPTMGALHAGHLSLIDHIAPHCDKVIVSVYVNPTQFAEGEDFNSYPRTLDSDLEKLQATPTALVYTPSTQDMYGDAAVADIKLEGPALGLESEARPHFFSGVASIVSRLFDHSQADVAVFGEKDYQQLCVIQHLVAEQKRKIKILGAPIMRETDGLAMSSRNVYLTPAQRKIAGKLNIILQNFCRAIADKIEDNIEDIDSEIAQAKAEILAAGFDGIDYLELRAANTLAPHPAPNTPRRALVVARIGSVRLLDNMEIKS